VIDRGRRPVRRGEYKERHGIVISDIANRIKVFKTLSVESVRGSSRI
jgi:hypothetical protein